MRYLFILLASILPFNAFGDAERERFDCLMTPLMVNGNNEGMYFIESDFHNDILGLIETGGPLLDINQATSKVQNWFKSKNINMELGIKNVALKQYDCLVSNELKFMHVFIFFLDNPENIVGVTMQGRLIERQPIK
ncbi:hypothetical protein E5672_06435 [Alteromonas portus]|uniref:Uncharacterized protein n=1 Tax=Alteromonas portus TaxID=2565549 RepID=A0A4U0ZL25_9ALTE|nr:hypothetical protein E5672_06435 [Alteromonas portus]